MSTSSKSTSPVDERLAPLAVQTLRDEARQEPAPKRSPVHRMTTADVREQNTHLREAAEQSMNVIIDLTLDGLIRWTSSSWQNVVGTKPESVQNKPMSELVPNTPSIFADAVQALQDNDAGSKVIRFQMAVGPDSLLRDDNLAQEPAKQDQQDTDLNDQVVDDGKQTQTTEQQVVDLEAQGIMVYDPTSGKESHTMWMMRPAVQREVTIDLPEILVESLGVGADMLAQYLTSLAEAGANDPANHPPPMPVLCRICERQITPWWFPKHSELCLQEHQAEAELQLAQENLTEHRNQIVRVLDGLEAQTRYRNQPPTGEGAISAPPHPEYKGHPIGQPSNPSSSAASSARPSPARHSSVERSASRPTGGHSRSRSFTVRRPLARIVELVLDLCDTALEINTPALKEGRVGDSDEIRTQSPQSEGRIHQVQQWQSPSAGALENEAGLTALCDDTAKLSKAKADAVLLYRRILEYSERIRSEFAALVQECIDAALQKAARIAAGDISSDDLSDASSTSRGEAEGEEEEEEETEEHEEQEETPLVEAPAEVKGLAESLERPSSLAMALRDSRLSRSPSSHAHRRMSSAAISSNMSTRSSSPRGGTSTPKSSGLVPTPHEISRSSTLVDTDVGGDSDSSMRSSVHSRSNRANSRADELGRPAGSSRERKRTSLVLPRAISTSRHPSPARHPNQPSSPLRISKPRAPSGQEPFKSPLISPTLSGNEFQSPVISSMPPSSLHNHRHHRRQSSAASSDVRAPVSPHMPMSGVPQQPRAIPPSIRDFEIIKPISKGAFGSVYLAKKKSTGEYYAIKALKKADMVSKNQVTNVKAERAIMMWQGESDFVAKLYWTFPSKDYVFLVMEYLNGGDCASLVRIMGTLPEDWAKRYIAEVVLGVEHLHGREIVHRDLKPDNLLIDQKGHLKLTDFGLSRMGLIGRQKRALKAEGSNPPDPLKQGQLTRSTSVASSRSASFDFQGHFSPGLTPSLSSAATQESNQPSYFSLSRESSGPFKDREPSRQNSGHQSDSADSIDPLSAAFRRFSLYDDTEHGHSRSSPHSEDVPIKEEEDSADGYALRPTTSNTSSAAPKAGTPPTHPSTAMPPPAMALYDPDDNNRRFVGTPDYLAPETINGVGQDEMSDWWSLGCILFEFLFGYPPFHADTPDQVFENILQRRIDWPAEDDGEVSGLAKDLINKLICSDPSKRLGANANEKYSSGGEEIRHHEWFNGIEWDSLREAQPSFVPVSEHPESTEYFDTRGATHQDFTSEFEDQDFSPQPTPSEYQERPHDALGRVRSQVMSSKRGLMPLSIPPHVRENRSRRLSEPVVADDFGQFSFKNLPALEKANKDVIQKLRAEALQAQSRSHQQTTKQQPTPTPTPTLESSPMLTMPDKRKMSIGRPERSASPSQNSLAASSPSRGSQPPSPLVQFSASGQHHERRKTSSGSSHSGSLQPPAGFFDVPPRLSTSLKTASATSSPIRPTRSPSTTEKVSSAASASPRTRSHTIGSNDSEPRDAPSRHQKHRSQVLDVSPSSSDNDEARQKALLRVQRRRHSSRRISQISMNEGPVFRPLDILVCEDHPISRIVIEKVLEKLRCRAIIVQNGEEAMRYAMGSVKFDLIMTEFKLPQVNGSDVARMIRDTKNANSHTPIVAVTGYLKELQAPHHFDALIEKPPTQEKFEEIMSRLCHWRPPASGTPSPNLIPMAIPPAMPQSSLRNESFNIDQSPSSTTSTGFPTNLAHLGSSYHGSSRDDSLSSASVYTDEARSEAASSVGKQPSALEEWRTSGLGISDGLHQSHDLRRRAPAHAIASLSHSDSAPPVLDDMQMQLQLALRPRPSAEMVEARKKAIGKERPDAGDYGDDEDEELGNYRVRAMSPRMRETTAKPRSKLSAEPMMRSDSQSSVLTVSRHPLGDEPPTSALTETSLEPEEHASATTPPVRLAPSKKSTPAALAPTTAQPNSNEAEPHTPVSTFGPVCDTDPEATPKPIGSVSPGHRGRRT